MKTDHSDAISKLIGQWKQSLLDGSRGLRVTTRSLRVHYDDYTPDKGVVLDNDSNEFLFHIDWSLNPELLEMTLGRKGEVVINYGGGLEDLFKAMDPVPTSFSIRVNGEKK